MKLSQILSQTNMNNFNIEKDIVRSNTLYLFKEKVRIHHSNIILLEAKGNYTVIHLKNGKRMMIAKTLKSLEEKLDNHHFYRIHRAFLINSNHLMNYNASLGEVLLTDNHKIGRASCRERV